MTSAAADHGTHLVATLLRMQHGFIDPAKSGEQLGIEPCIHPQAKIRGSCFGTWCGVGARTSVTASVSGDTCDIANTTPGHFCSIAAQVWINPGNHPLDRVALSHFTRRPSAYGPGENDTAVFCATRDPSAE